MANKNLYRKYRPSNFDELVGQNYIKKTLNNAIKNDKISHAYLFTGPRGTGKTSFAKLFAKAINCLDYKDGKVCNECEMCKLINNNEVSDIIEMDAASNNGVDEIREIRNSVNILPSKCKYKVYIIDEVHMLSSGAFNALLKTLEEPPQHVVFILATTEVQKLPLTVISRCQNFDFKKISLENIKERLATIVKNEKIEIESEALNEIARISDGGLRDAIGLLDQLISYSDGNISLNDVYEITGGVSNDEICYLLESIENNDVKLVYEKINEMHKAGKDFYQVSEKIMLFLKDILIMHKISGEAILQNVSGMQKYVSIKDKIEVEKIYRLIKTFSNLMVDMKRTTQSKILFEIEILNLIDDNKINLKRNEDNFEYHKNSKETTAETKVVENKTSIEENSDKLASKVIDITENNIDLEKVEETKEIPEAFLNKEHNQEISNQYKRVIINNTVAMAEKKHLNDFMQNWKQLETLLLNKELKEAARILLDASITSASEDHLFLTYKYSSMVNIFDQQIEEIVKALKSIMGKKYTVVAITIEEWNEIRPYYLQMKKENKTIQLMSEQDILEKPKSNAKKNRKELNELNELFGENIIEVRG